MYRQRRLDGTEFVVRPEAPVPYRTDYEGYETWRWQYRDCTGCKKENAVRVHRLAAVAWFGYEAVAGDNTVVHHKNGIPWDNQESNLVPMGRVEHSCLHNPPGVNQRDRHTE